MNRALRSVRPDGVDEKFIASTLDVKLRKIVVSLPLEDGAGWAVYYYPSNKNSARKVWLVLVGVNGLLHGEPIIFDDAAAAITHAARGEWATIP